MTVEEYIEAIKEDSYFTYLWHDQAPELVSDDDEQVLRFSICTTSGELIFDGISLWEYEGVIEHLVDIHNKWWREMESLPMVKAFRTVQQI